MARDLLQATATERDATANLQGESESAEVTWLRAVAPAVEPSATILDSVREATRLRATDDAMTQRCVSEAKQAPEGFLRSDIGSLSSTDHAKMDKHSVQSYR